VSSRGPLEHPIQDYVPELRAVFERHHVILAFLYGSQARGNAGPLSDVDVVVDLAEASPLFKNKVRREGRLLYCADEAARVEFEVQTLRTFVDTQALRDLQCRYLLDRIEQGRMGQYAHPGKEIAGGQR
jgi:predicted nucleotidyltransferase